MSAAETSGRPGAASVDPLRDLPKVELHRHLDGSVRLATILELAKEHDIDVGERTLAALGRRALVTSPMKDLETVLRCFSTLQSVQCSFAAISRVAYENVEDAWRDGVRLIELRFAPAFIAAGKSIANPEIFAAVVEGTRRACAAYPVEAGLICILARGQPLQANRAALEDLIRWRESGRAGSQLICGLDLADAEDRTDPREFAPLVERARGAGLGITVHSGENTTAEHVRAALDLYRPSRIGHGIKAWGDDELMVRLREEGVLLEVSLTSNWLTSSVPCLADHPLPHLYRAGVPVCINSDDPNLFAIDLVNEYRVCRDLYGLTEEDFRRMNLDALAHSFLPRPARERVREGWFSS
jgi:adenosine deaminase